MTMNVLYYVLLTLVYSLNYITIAMPTADSTKSPDSSSEDKRTGKAIDSKHRVIDAQKIEEIKKELLQKLGMKNRPDAIVNSQPIPQALLDEFYNDVEKHEKEYWEREESNIKKVIVEARSYDQCGDDNKCIQFKYKPKTSGTEITSLNLWVYQQPQSKNPVVTFTILNSQNKPQHVLLRSRLRSTQKGWASITIEKPEKWLSTTDKGPTDLDKSGKASPSIDLVIKVECTGCHIRTKRVKLPLLEFQETNRLNRRQRRSSTQCQKGGKSESCCLDDFTITFKEIGWDDWIISPKFYNAKKCRGDCEQSHTGLNDHASIMKLLSTRNNNNKLKRCCTPQRFEPIYILYRKEHKIVKQKIKDMVIAECGCA